MLGIAAALALLAGSLLAAKLTIAQTVTLTAGAGTNTQSATITNAATGEQATGTNAAPGERRGRRGGRGRGGPAPTFPAGEAERLLKLGNRNLGVHDPSTIAKSGDDYWIFWTGNGVLSAHSKDLVTWTRGPQVITNTPSWTTNVSGFRGRNFWAPDVLKFGDRYLLYYSASAFGKNTSGIGLTTNPTLDPTDPNYKWTDQGMVVGSGTNVDYNTIDPAIAADADGGLWLAFGSFWSGIKLIQLDPKTGLRIAPDSEMYSLAHHSSIEAAYIYHHDKYYYLFVNWGICCRGYSSTYEIRVGRCDKITGPYLDREGKDLLLDGGTKMLATDGAMIGPGHAGILEESGKSWFGFHFYDGTQNGASKYAIRPMHWDKDGWPQIDVAGD